MTKDVVTIDAEKTVFEAAELMCQKEISDLVVVDGKKPVGIVTERDFVRRVVAKSRRLCQNLFGWFMPIILFMKQRGRCLRGKFGDSQYWRRTSWLG
jgi:CBS-domain-containing membrane protein